MIMRWGKKLGFFVMNSTWAQILGLIFITMCAAGLRFYKLGEWSFWIDEIYSINHARFHFSTLDLIREHIPPARNWLPLSVIFTAQVLNAWGVNEWNARLVSTLVGIVSLPVLYFPIKNMLGSKAALIAVVLLAISPWHIFWSQNARFYTSLMLYYSLALFIFYFAVEKNRPHYFIYFYLLFYLAMSERMIAVFLLPVAAIYLLILGVAPIKKPAGYNLRNILIVSAPILLFLIAQLYLIATTGTFMFAYDLEILAPPIDSPSRILIVTAFSIGLPVLVLGFFSGSDLILKKDRAGLFLFLGAVLPLIMIAAASPFFFIVERYAFVALVFWVSLAAIGALRIFSTAGKREFVLGLGIFIILAADAAGEGLMYYQINRGNRLDWREAVGYIKERKQDGDVVVATRGELASYYLGEEVKEYQNMTLDDLKAFDRPTWYLIEYPGVWHGTQESKTWMENQADLVYFSYLRLREQTHMSIYYFTPTQKP